jgi:hypothetical protein
MSAGKPFFTKSFSQTLSVIRCMASPEGTTVNELARSLSLTRRSVFRLIRTIEHEYHIPVTVKREKFGGSATYHLSQPFIDGFSQVKTPPMALTFDEALSAYLLATLCALPGGENYSHFKLLKNVLEQSVVEYAKK